MSLLIDSSIITKLHQDSIIQWKAEGMGFQYKEFYKFVEENHSYNYQLWHAEDRARRNDKGYEFVYQAKREIDNWNQLRNNSMEAMDKWLFESLNPVAPDKCPVHSESPGMIIDRLSILALKSYHMNLQTLREDVDEAHKILCKQKLFTIKAQLSQLALCLEQLIEEIQNKTRTFRIYHQFKMYNDPALNPELYNQ